MSAATAWADDLLALLRQGPKTASQLAHDLSLNRPSLDAALAELQQRGYGIGHGAGGTLNLASIPDLLIADEIEHATAGLRLGRPLHTFGRVSSTNTLASELAGSGAPEGTLVTAEEQTRGRGRQGRSWASPPGVGIWMSLVLRPPVEPTQAGGLSLVGGLAVAAAIRTEVGADAMVKWPNDVYIEGRKVCGVLCESVLEGARVRYTVMGIGINVNHKLTDWPLDLRATAASVRTITGQTFPRVTILAAVLRELEARYACFGQHGFAALREEYRLCSYLTGRQVTVTQDAGEIHGTAVDIAPDGSLLVEAGTRIETIQVGDATLRMD